MTHEPPHPPSDGPVWTIVLAAGSGRRFGGAPKQFALLGDERVIDRSLAVARSAADHVVLVVSVEGEGEAAALLASGAADVAVIGGAERSDSVRAALAVIDDDAAVIVVHDAARPLASGALHQSVVDAVHAGAEAAIPGVAVTDTIKVVSHGPDGSVHVVDTPDRSGLVSVQTPQAFRASVLRAAHASGLDATDDAALVELLGARVEVVPGEITNLKITDPHDLEVALLLLDRL